MAVGAVGRVGLRVLHGRVWLVDERERRELEVGGRGRSSINKVQTAGGKIKFV